MARIEGDSLSEYFGPRVTCEDLPLPEVGGTVPGTVINDGNNGGPSLDVLFDPKLSACRQEKSWGQLSRSVEWGTRYFTGGLGKLMMKDQYEVWICAKGDSCSPAGDMMCYVFNERLKKFEPLALNSRLHFV